MLLDIATNFMTFSDVTDTTNTIIITSTTNITSTIDIMSSIEPTSSGTPVCKLKHIR